MSVTARILSALLIAGLTAPAVRADDEKPKKPAEPTKPLIIQLDASKLPPDVLKQLLQLAKPTEPTKPGAEKPAAKPEKPPAPEKPGAKPEKPPVKPGSPEKPAAKPEKPGAEKPGKSISLADAVAIAEKTAQGTAVRAERTGDGSAAMFVVVVQTAKGGKASVAIDASGKVAGEKGEKGDKKKTDDDDDKKGKKKDDDDKKGKKKDDDDKKGKKKDDDDDNDKKKVKKDKDD